MNFLRVARPPRLAERPFTVSASRVLRGGWPAVPPTLSSPLASVARRRYWAKRSPGHGSSFTDYSEVDNNPPLPTKASHKSNRQLFSEIPVDPSILSYVRRIGVGIPARRRRRSASSTATVRNRASSSGEPLPPSSSVPSPPPFGSGSRVRVVRSQAAMTAGSEAVEATMIVPEVALLGRCNVGKSTLLNALLYGNKRGGRPGLGKGPDKAVMSARPGETRDVAVYHLSRPVLDAAPSPANRNSPHPRGPASRSSMSRLRLVDLPGYGFAHGSSSQDATAPADIAPPPPRHHRVVQDYLLGGRGRNRALKRILLLVDARHGLKRTDVEFLSGLEQLQRDLPAPVQIVLTKCDLVSQTDLARRAGLVRRELAGYLRRQPPGSHLPVMFVSARSAVSLGPRRSAVAGGDGVLELQRQLAALAVLRP